MLTGSWGDTQEQVQVVEQHLREMRAAAERERLVRQMRAAARPRSIRRTVGGLLIAAGHALCQLAPLVR